MKTFFVVSQPGSREDVDSSKIATTLETIGNKVTTSLVSDKVTVKDDPEKFYKKILNNIKKSECVVVEVTKPNTGIGLIISHAVEQKKPVLIIFDQTRIKTAPLSIIGMAGKNKLVQIAGYNKNNLTEVFNKFFDSIKNLLDTKFILIISPEIDAYLQWASDNRRMHKAQVVRRAVEQVMHEDKEYKKHSNSLKKF